MHVGKEAFVCAKHLSSSALKLKLKLYRIGEKCNFAQCFFTEQTADQGNCKHS